MNKKLIIFAGAILILLMVVIAIVTVVMSSKQKPAVQTNTTAPTITTVPVNEDSESTTAPQPSPVVLSSSPSDGQQQVPISTKSLTLQLQGTPIQKSEDVIIRIDPPTQFSYRAKDGRVQITFLENLQEGITYSYSISVNEGTPYIASFKTAGIGPTAKPGIEPPGFYEEQMAQQKENNPDIYISNLVPYESATFEIESSFVESPAEHFEFVVTRKGSSSQTQVTSDVKKWMLDQGITEAQFSSLDIVYK